MNNSDEPIYRVAVPHLVGNDTTSYALIPSGERREKPMSRADREQFHQEHTGERVVPLAFSFADSSSALWQRSKEGRLHGGWRYRWPRKT
ncbi:hypothetical protein AB0B04_19360 [Streptomyces xinghaiensis]|uniref:hypothetical protein n=1 Tax=Streptomyces TaxID=1883 RepID=UPI00114CD549|nr:MULTISPECIES: hypothetical protein [Streptomyces]